VIVCRQASSGAARTPARAEQQPNCARESFALRTGRQYDLVTTH
jgi:hypothetical protein